MAEREIAIQIQGLKKRYKLGQIGGGTLTGDLQSWWARVRGKEDPNTKIGTNARGNGKTFMALDGIDLTIYKGERIGIIGNNGAGKSTLLKLLSRITSPTAGCIDIYGRISSMLEVGTGFNRELTGRENIYMNGAILGMTKAEIDRKIDDIIAFSECERFIDTPVKRYSSGMYVKLAFAVVSHLDSEIMVMDEVLAVGDVNFQQKCLQKMKALAEDSGRTVLYVSHNMSTIKQLCSRCIVLAEGKIIFDGDVDEGIAIYSANREMQLQKVYDLSNVDRESGITKLCRLHTVELERTEIDMHGVLRFQLRITAESAMENGMFRMIIYNRIGMPVGTVYSKPYTLNAGENTLFCAFQTKGLVAGKYHANIVLCQYQDGIQTKHDSVLGAFSFLIEETETYYNLRWRAGVWGSVKFDDIEIE